MPESSHALAVEGVNKSFGELQTLRDVSFAVEAGEKRALIGPNGAGKTSLFNIIGGQWRPSSGRVRLVGRKVDRHPPHRRARLGISRTFQITNLFFELTVEENLLLAVQGLRRGKLNLVTPRALNRAVRDEVAEMLARARMSERSAELVKNLAYGEQRLLEVLVALASRPRILLLDEPTAGLSPVETESMITRLQELGEGLTMIVIEHDMDVCFRLVDSITVLHHGTVIADGTKDEVRNDASVQEIYLGALQR
jgi:branched-chain amino acid transport system ATP-binding protein